MNRNRKKFLRVERFNCCQMMVACPSMLESGSRDERSNAMMLAVTDYKC
jgi:hypothetical protein